MRVKITLACTECKQRNYNWTKDKKAHPERMEVNKYCRFCRKHTPHNPVQAKEGKKWERLTAKKKLQRQTGLTV